MAKNIKKPQLKGYGSGIKIFAGITVVTTIIVGGYFGYKYLNTKPSNTSNVKTVNSTTTNNIKTLNGQYSGTSSVAQGLSEVSVTIAGTNLTGSAVYIGPYNVRIPGLKITGTVKDNSISTQAKGNIQGTFTGSGTVMGQNISVNGSFSGHIINTSMNVSYSAVTTAGTYPGQITLSKKQ